MLENLTESTMETNKAMEKISDSIASVGKSIGDGLTMLAAAFTHPNAPHY